MTLKCELEIFHPRCDFRKKIALSTMRVAVVLRRCGFDRTVTGCYKHFSSKEGLDIRTFLAEKGLDFLYCVFKNFERF